MTSPTRNRRPLSTVNRSTSRLGRLARVELSFAGARRCAQTIPRRHGATDQKSDARRWNRMGQKAFQHMLGTFITSDQTTRAQDQRVGRDGGGARPVKKRHRGERCAWCRLLSVVGLVDRWASSQRSSSCCQSTELIGRYRRAPADCQCNGTSRFTRCAQR